MLSITLQHSHVNILEEFVLVKQAYYGDTINGGHPDRHTDIKLWSNSNSI